MTKSEIIKRLRSLSAEMQHPHDVGIAIDVILEKVKDTLHYDKKL